MSTKLTLKLAALSVTVALTACSSVHNNEEATSAASTTGNEFTQFKNDRPEAKSAVIGDESTDLVFNSIAGIYDKTIKLTDSYITKVELAGYNQLTKLAETDPEAYQAEYAKLPEAEKKEYDEFLNTSSEMTKQSLGLLVEAYKLQKSVQQIDIKALVSNPMKLPSAMKGASLAGDQISFTVDALSMLKKYHGIYNNAISYAGR